MAGHSQYANIKHRKAGQDAKRAKLFTKLTREILVAASSGQSDPAFNPRLRNALIAARRAGVPKDRIETSVKKGAGEIDSEHYEEIRYEGYGSNGIALIVEALSDNRNRTASDVRSCFTKHGGNLGETGSVNFMFDRIGLIEYKKEVADVDAIFEAAAEAGASDVESDDVMHSIICDPDSLMAVRDQLAAKYDDPESAKLAWKAKEPIEIDDKEIAEKILKLVDALEDNDDVQEVTGNFTIADTIIDQLA